MAVSQPACIVANWMKPSGEIIATEEMAGCSWSIERLHGRRKMRCWMPLERFDDLASRGFLLLKHQHRNQWVHWDPWVHSTDLQGGRFDALPFFCAMGYQALTTSVCLDKPLEISVCLVGGDMLCEAARLETSASIRGGRKNAPQWNASSRSHSEDRSCGVSDGS